MFVFVVCVVLVVASATSCSLVQRSPTGYVCVCVCMCMCPVVCCDLETSTWRRSRPDLDSCVTEIKQSKNVHL